MAIPAAFDLHKRVLSLSVRIAEDPAPCARAPVCRAVFSSMALCNDMLPLGRPSGRKASSLRASAGHMVHYGHRELRSLLAVERVSRQAVRPICPTASQSSIYGYVTQLVLVSACYSVAALLLQPDLCLFVENGLSCSMLPRLLRSLDCYQPPFPGPLLRQRRMENLEQA